LPANMIGKSRRQTFRNLELVSGTLIDPHCADMIKGRSRRGIESAATHFEQVTGGLQRAEKKFLLAAAERRRCASGNHCVTDFFNRVQGLASYQKRHDRVMPMQSKSDAANQLPMHHSAKNC
jgi:hypothetical protein